jgi:imidazolonepropionase-like amidohydrolase
MKRLTVIALGIMIASAGFAQEAPTELESDRAPKLKTGGNVLIRNGRIVTVTKGTLPVADLLILNGKIAKIGPNLSAPTGTKTIDAKGRVVTPGIVDGHIHRGSFETNEGTDSITAEVRMGDLLNPAAKSIWQALAGGETTGMLLHGSANAVGGESQVIKLKYRRPVEELRFPGAPRMVKFALGENVTRSGSTTSTRFPKTRMGVQALYRRAFTEAREYRKARNAWLQSRQGPEPRYDVRLETLADILDRKVWVQCHSYRADEMLMMVRLSQEFGFKIGAMQHALEAYKIAPELAKAGVGVSIFADNWSFKVEGYDAIPYNAWLCTRAGVNVSVNTDGTGGVPAIAIDAAKAMRYGGLSEDQAMALITINPAKQLGVDKRVGSIEVGKDGDVVIWDGHPLSVYSRVNKTLIDGEVFFEQRDAFATRGTSTFKPILSVNKKTKPLNIPANPIGYVIYDATIHPVSGPTIEKGSVVIMGGKITQVGKTVRMPRGAQMVNGAGLHVYPGFIDAGTSMGLQEISGIGQMVDTTELGSVQGDLIAATAIQTQSEHFPVARMNGVLATLCRPSGGVVSGQASVIHTFGWNWEQMAMGSRMLVLNLGGGGFGGFGEHAHEEDCCGVDESARDVQWDDMLGGALQGGGGQGGGGASVEDAERAISQAKAYYEKRKTSPSTPANLSFEGMRPYLEGKAPVLIRATNVAAIRRAVEFADKHKLKVVLAGCTEAHKVAKMLAEKKIPVIITASGRATLGSNGVPNEWDPYDTSWAQAALLKRAGVKFAFQTESNADSYNLPIRVGQSCAYGLRPADALRSITLDAAEILGVGSQLGSIQAGKLGSLVITDGDPFELTTNVVGVFVNGTPRPLVSRFTRLRDQWLSRQAEK